jgi:hypothetical protein
MGQPVTIDTDVSNTRTLQRIAALPGSAADMNQPEKNQVNVHG